MTPSLLLRVDADEQIGLGHLRRCLALAQAWREAGGIAAFAARASRPEMLRGIGEAGFDRHDLPCVVSPADDAQTVGELAQHAHADWIVLDGYHFTPEYQSRIGALGRQTLLIDDGRFADRYVADAVLNPSLDAEHVPYARSDARLLLGSTYAMLTPALRQYATHPKAFASDVRRLLITMGGSDPSNATCRMLEALGSAGRLDIALRIVVGPGNRNLAAVRAAAARLPLACEIIVDPADMGPHLAWADVAISAAGSTCWEAAHLGLPCLAVVTADNQAPVARALAERQVIVDLGPLEAIAGALARELPALIDDSERRAAMSRRGLALIDGCGAGRVAAALREETLRLRPVVAADGRRIWSWGNDPLTRSASFRSAPIAWETHATWFAERVGRAEGLFLIGERLDGTPVGQVRYDVADGIAEIAIGIAPEQRGQGWARRLLRLSTRMVSARREVRELRAHVRPNNAASLALFRRAGFGNEALVERYGQPAIQLRRAREPAA